MPTRPGDDPPVSSRTPGAADSVSAWLDLIARETARRTSGVQGALHRNLGRARTVVRLYQAVGVREATGILFAELRGIGR